jgi:magnesium-protoporphyrin IX monomethyl ester (oxidative) cyclase
LSVPSLQFNQHVIIETNKTTERIFPAVPDVEHPEFFNKMDELVKLNEKVRTSNAFVLQQPQQQLLLSSALLPASGASGSLVG